MERYVQIGKYNVKYNMPVHLAVCIFLLILGPFVVGIRNLDPYQTAKVLEMYVALLGIIMLTPVFLPEQNKEARDLVTVRSVGPRTVQIIRILQAMLALAALTLASLSVLAAGGCTFSVPVYFWGTMAEMTALGGVGILFYALTDQIVVGYMIPILYYLVAFGTRNKYLGKFYLFSMMEGRYEEKIWLAVLGILCMTAGIWLRNRRK